jgi:hypothetical protein
MRKGDIPFMSESVEDDLLSVVLAKNGKKIICGSREGTNETI